MKVLIKPQEQMDTSSNGPKPPLNKKITRISKVYLLIIFYEMKILKKTQIQNKNYLKIKIIIYNFIQNSYTLP